MKVFDATTLIAFLSDMRFPEGLEALSKRYKLVVPQAVADEIKKAPGRQLLRNLAKKGVVRIESVDPKIVEQIEKENPQLHKGECEVIAFAQSFDADDDVYLLSDDRLARNKFQNLNFKWTEELMNHMKARGIIDPATYDSKINELHHSPFYHSGRKNH